MWPCSSAGIAPSERTPATLQYSASFSQRCHAEILTHSIFVALSRSELQLLSEAQRSHRNNGLENSYQPIPRFVCDIEALSLGLRPRESYFYIAYKPREWLITITAVLGNLAILCGRRTKCAHAPKFKSYAAPLNFSVRTHASSTVGDFNFARLTKTAVLAVIPRCSRTRKHNA